MVIVANSDLDRSRRAHDDFAEFLALRLQQVQMRAGADGAVQQLAAVGIDVDQLDVVVDVAPVLERIDAAHADDVIRRRAEHPVSHVDLMRS